MGNVIVQRMVFQAPAEPCYAVADDGTLVLRTRQFYESSKLAELRVELISTLAHGPLGVASRSRSATARSPMLLSPRKAKRAELVEPRSKTVHAHDLRSPRHALHARELHVARLLQPAQHSIACAFIEHPAAEFTVLYSHATSEDLGTSAQNGAELANALQANVFVYDYSGYGLSGGRATEQQLYLDARAALQYLVCERGVPLERTVLMGRSLGAAVTVELATSGVEELFGGEAKGAFPLAVVLVSALASVARVLHAGIDKSPPFDMLCAIDRMRLLARPVLLVHGDSDELIPVPVAKSLLAEARRALPASDATLRIFPECGHNSLESKHRVALFEEYASFIEVCLALPPGSRRLDGCSFALNGIRSRGNSDSTNKGAATLAATTADAGASSDSDVLRSQTTSSRTRRRKRTIVRKFFGRATAASAAVPAKAAAQTRSISSSGKPHSMHNERLNSPRKASSGRFSTAPIEAELAQPRAMPKSEGFRHNSKPAVVLDSAPTQSSLLAVSAPVDRAQLERAAEGERGEAKKGQPCETKRRSSTSVGGGGSSVSEFRDWADIIESIGEDQAAFVRHVSGSLHSRS